MEFIDLKTQLENIRPAIDKRIGKVLDHGQFIMGPEVFELEEKLADYVGVKHCISCANGTDALQISLMALGVGPGDIVFTTAFSFFATAEVIPLVGATPFFADIDKTTFNLCPVSLENAIQLALSNGLGIPKAVIAVDMFGLAANYPELQAVCDKYNLLLIEDGAQSFGARIGNKHCGSFGHIATTSFFPAKPLGCYGDGGAIFTESDDLAEICSSIRIHGKGEHKYENIRMGLNSRLDTIQAAILLEKLLHLNGEIANRETICKYYNEILSSDFILPLSPDGFHSAWAQYSIRPKNKLRENLCGALKELGIPTAIYYPIPLNKQRALLGCHTVDTFNCDEVAQTIFSLPISEKLNLNALKRLVE